MKTKWNLFTVDRKGYVDTVKALYQVGNALHKLRTVGSENDWTGAEAVCEALFSLMLPDKKCRIVVEYDPANPKICAYQTD